MFTVYHTRQLRSGFTLIIPGNSVQGSTLIMCDNLDRGSPFIIPGNSDQGSPLIISSNSVQGSPLIIPINIDQSSPLIIPGNTHRCMKRCTPLKVGNIHTGAQKPRNYNIKFIRSIISSQCPYFRPDICESRYLLFLALNVHTMFILHTYFYFHCFQTG